MTKTPTLDVMSNTRSLGAPTTHVGMPGGIPGKHAATEALPGRPRETGHPLLDRGLYCTDQPAGTPGCYLDRGQEVLLVQMLAVAALAACDNLFAALGKVRVDLLTRKSNHWGGAHEVAFLLITGALAGPLSVALSAAVVRVAPRIAEIGAGSAAWAAASYEPGKAVRALGVAFRGLRSELAHGGAGLPTSQLEFLDYLSTLVQPTASRILQSVAAEDLNHDEMLALHDTLNDQSLVGVGAIERRIRDLLESFEENRLGVVGNTIFGGREVACPVRVHYRRARYLALCESFGIHHSALELNGRPELSMDSLVWVRLVERPFHDLMEAEFRERRRADPPEVDFNQPSERARHRWSGDFYTELGHHAHPAQLAMAGSDDDQDGFQP